MKDRVPLVILTIVYTIFLIGMTVLYGVDFINLIPYMVLCVYFFFNVVSYGKGVVWFTKFTVYSGTALLTILSGWKAIFPNGIEAPQLALIVVCVEVIDLWFENHGRTTD